MKKFLLFILILSKIIFAQISPGELSNPHSKFEGLSNCTKCHTIGEGLSNDKCLGCHTEIKNRIIKKTGYHSSSEVLNKNCWKCHSDHNGKNFQLVRFDSKTFDHKKTGFELNGKHKYIECNECHQSKFTSGKESSRKGTFLGLNGNCISCHYDIHKKTTTAKCESCHNTESFVSNIKFDHSKTRFQLIGAHKNVECLTCHKKSELNGIKELRFVKSVKVSCIDCHKDIHQGKFGQNCLQCHNYNSFAQITESNFEHSKTNFPLLGRHQFVECKDCHKQKISTPIKYSQCKDCHLDYHKGEFVNENIVRDCKDCHNEKGFSPSYFTIELHQQSKFSLTGSHLAIECKNCHYKNSEWKFKFANFSCTNCHTNIHKDEITIKFMGNNNCENCHNTLSWNVKEFDHNQTNFQLKGKHSLISCSDCHIKQSNGFTTHTFKSLKSDCLSCHNDFHFKQFSSNECIKCHNYNNWIPSTFNHNSAQFKLAGAHETVECNKCHPTIESKESQQTVKYILYKTKRIKCIDCHLS
ncbi:MAG: hypothetical protein STSR0008_11770 [Ignavibacterium sp.]